MPTYKSPLRPICASFYGRSIRFLSAGYETRCLTDADPDLVSAISKKAPNLLAKCWAPAERSAMKKAAILMMAW